MRAVVLFCLLAVASGLVVVGVVLMSTPWAFIVGGIELAGLAVFSLADL